MGLGFGFGHVIDICDVTLFSFSSCFSVTHAGLSYFVFFFRLRHLHIPRCSDP